MELRRIVRKLEKRNKHLERQNMENQYQMHFIGNNEPSQPIMKNSDPGSKKMSIPPTGLSKHNSVPSLEPNLPVKAMKKMKSSNNPKLGNYKSDHDNHYSSALVRNGDYAMQTDNWQRVEQRYKKPPSPMVAISGTSMSSDNEEDKYSSLVNRWS